MAIIKENLIPILIILVAGLVVSFAAVPLQDTDWAENMRMEVGAEGEERANFTEENSPPNSSLLVILPLVKVTILMGIGGALTALVLWLIRVFQRGRNRLTL